MVSARARRAVGSVGAAARRAVPVLGFLVVVTLGGAVGWALTPPASAFVGPLEIEVDVRPSLDPGVDVDLPPVGRVAFETHLAPVAVQTRILSVDLDAATSLLSSPQALLALQVTAPQVLQDATLEAAARSAACTLGGAVVAALLVYRRPRRGLQAGAVGVVALLLLTTGVVRTFDPAALQAPRFDGLLSRAPYVAGTSRDVAERLESYRSGLSDVVRSVTTLYAVAGDLPPQVGDSGTTTVLHISDIHLNPLGFDVADRLVEQFAVDVVVDTGDVTTWGTALESGTLERIGQLGVPYVFVRGNHDSRATQAAVAEQPGAIVLDGDVAEVAGLRFAGIGDPLFTPEVGGTADAEDREQIRRATAELARAVRASGRAGEPVDVALIHDPSALDPVFGDVPLVLAGHYHRRITRVDPDSGTRVMVQGSTGGAGITARGLERLSEGEPLALTATLLRFATEGERAGQLVAYDEVTVGGLGLTSVQIERTIVPPEGADDTDGDPDVDVDGGTDVDGEPAEVTPTG